MVGARTYEILERLGQGAFGAVYRAQVIGVGVPREVAIKVLHAERAVVPSLVRRLRDEARMLAMIRHRAIVRVEDLVELDGNWSIVMEYVEGCDVAAVLGEGPLPCRVALTIAEEAANALHSAWQQPGPDGRPLQLIHRDIKPSNLRLTAQGELKLLDFGVARADFAEREAGTTQSGFGTLAYMAAERFEGRDSHASDVYALGVTLFEMLSGVPPGEAAAHPDRQPPGQDLAAEWASIARIHPELHTLLADMLAFEPDRRPTARECAIVLGNLRGRVEGERIEDWAARIVPRVLDAGRVQATLDPLKGSMLVEGAAKPVPAPRRVAVPWIGLAVVAFVGLSGLVVLAGAWWFLHTGPPEPVAAVSPMVVPPPVEVPAPTVRPAPAPAPRAVSTRAPSPAAPAPVTGRLLLAGDPVTVALTGPSGAASPGAVPPGTYVAQVTFAAGATVVVRDIRVTAGRTTRLRCNADFNNCLPEAE